MGVSTHFIGFKIFIWTLTRLQTVQTDRTRFIFLKKLILVGGTVVWTVCGRVEVLYKI